MKEADTSVVSQRAGAEAAKQVAVTAKQDAANARSRANLFATLIVVIGITGFLLVAWLIVRSINKSLKRVIAGLNECAGGVAGSSRQVADASNSLASEATEQAATIEETAASRRWRPSPSRMRISRARRTA